MKVIVKHKESGQRFLLIGSGFSVNKEKPSFFSNTKGGTFYHDMLCCVNKTGEIGWLKSAEMEVVTIDGMKPSEFEID